MRGLKPVRGESIEEGELVVTRSLIGKYGIQDVINGHPDFKVANYVEIHVARMHNKKLRRRLDGEPVWIVRRAETGVSYGLYDNAAGGWVNEEKDQKARVALIRLPVSSPPADLLRVTK